jgi:hypothetical protein
MGEKAASQPAEQGRWPFDPMQPGDHEPVRLPDSAKRLEKQNPPPKEEQEKKS